MGNRILVVDDNSMNLKMAEFILKKNNYVVIMAESGQECLELLDNEKIDLILLDIEMPQMSGIETLEKIRGKSGMKDKKVMFLTASADDEETLREAKKLGVLQIISKPFVPDVLLEAVENAL